MRMNQLNLIWIVCLVQIYLRKLVYGEGMIYPTRPPRNAILDQNSKTLLTLYFRVSTELTANNYLRIELPDYSSTGLNPQSCLLKYSGDTTFTVSQCGIMSATTMYVQLSKPVVNLVDSENVLQVELDTLNPLNNISQSIRVATISSIQDAIYFKYDENLNFGQIPFTKTNNDIFQAKIISYGTDLTRNIPGEKNIVKIQIEINKSFGIDQNMSRIKLIVTSPWIFSSDTTVKTYADDRFILVSDDRKSLYKQPELIVDQTDPTKPNPVVKTLVETPTQLSIVFNQGFKEGSAFILEVDNILNPGITAQGVLKIYSLPVNSNESVEQNDKILALETFQTPISVQLLPSIQTTLTNLPINFYKNTKQYVTVQINIQNKVIEANYPILLEFTPNTKIIKGSEYLDKFMKDSNNAYLRQVEYRGQNVMIIRNIAKMVGSVTQQSISIQTRVLLSKVDAQFSVKVYIYSDSNLTNPQFSGVSNIVPLQTNYNSVITQISDTSLNQNGFVLQTENKLKIVMQVGSNDILSDSQLELYVSKKVTSSASLTCTKNSVAFASCSYNDLTDLKKFTLKPMNFDSTLSTFIINLFQFSKASNHEDAVYELFFRLIKQSTAPVQYTDFMIPITVKQSPATFIDFQHINDLNQSVLGQLDYSFPSFIDIIDKKDTFKTLSITPSFNSATQRYYISLYSSQGFESIAQKPSIGEQFYCGSSLSGVSCYYKEKDDTTTVDPSLFKEWAKIIFFLPTTTQEGYHMIIPFLFDLSANYQFQVEIGVYNLDTYIFDVYNTQTIKTVVASTTLASVQNKCDDTQINLRGFAGSKVSNVEMQVSCDVVLPANSVQGQGASAILITDWEFWFEISQYKDLSSGIVGDKQNSPVSVKYIDKTGSNRFVVVFPLISDPKALNSDPPKSVFINNVVLPFSYDLPNLLFIITQNNGKLNCFKRYFNSGRNIFYKSTPKSLAIECIQQANGVQNTQCTVKFQPAQNIQRYAILKMQFSGMQINTNECTLIQKNTVASTIQTISQQCSVSTNSRELTVKLSENQIYSNDASTYSYELSFYGISIDQDSTKGFTFEIRDLSGNTAIEQQDINVATTQYSAIYIQVSQLIYKYLNPYVFSQLTVQFATPRELLPNENVVVSLGSDLSDVNSNTDRLTVTLFKIDNTDPLNPVLVNVKMAVTFSQNIMRIQLTDRSQFIAGNYKMIIDGLLTPASNSNDLISIRFIRNYDEGLVLQNIASTSVPFPSLLGKTNSDIVLRQANFLMEGSISEFIFDITMKNSQIISTSKMYIYFPIYYPPSILNFPDYIYCRMENINIPCKYNQNPFRLELSESPLFIQPGQQFSLLVYGPIAPQYTLRNNPLYINETIFFAVDTGSQNSFSEFIHLTPPQVIQIPNDYPYMRLISASTADTNTRALSTHTFIVETQIVLPAGHLFQVIFPTEYQFLKITSNLQCMISYTDSTGKLINTAYQTCLVKGLSVEGSLPISISAKTRYTITIQKVPTPDKSGFVDISRTIIGIFPSTREKYITQTNYLTNQMGTLQFVEQNNFVQINGGKEIKVTKGTYSPDIQINTANNQKFIANMVIDLSAKGFTFNPPSMNIYLGDLSTSFRVGADKNLLEKQYSVDIVKKEFGFQPIYQIANNLIVFVISQPIDINTPAQINVPYNGCSLPYIIKLTSTPFDDVNISIQYDYNALPEGILVVDIELSSYTLYFDRNISYRYLSLCSTPKFPETITTFTATLSLGGSNIESFRLVNPNMQVNMVKKDASISPSLTVSIKQMFRTSGQFNVLYNVDGTVYWQVFVQGTSAPLTLSQIKERLKTQRTVIQSPTTLEQQFFGKKTDERVGLNVFLSSQTDKFFEIKSLIPETSYQLCAYFEDELQVSTKSQCISFTTQNWQLFTKINISFKIKMFGDDMNNLLCFFVRNTQTKIKNIINSDGNSCSLQAVTLPYYFQFKGKTASNSRTQTNIYLIPDADLENDTSITSLENQYDATTKAILSSVLQLAEDQYNINYIKDSFYKLKFTYENAIKKQSDFAMPTISNIKFEPVAYNFNSTIEIQDISLSSDGQLYFIAERTATILFDNVKGEKYESPITVMDDPLPEDIINCRNRLGYKADKCARAIYNNNNIITLILDDLVPDTKYTIYYIIANHFPITPVYDSKVNKKEIVTLPFKSTTYSSNLSLPSLVLLLICFFLYL